MAILGFNPEPFCCVVCFRVQVDMGGVGGLLYGLQFCTWCRFVVETFYLGMLVGVSTVSGGVKVKLVLLLAAVSANGISCALVSDCIVFGVAACFPSGKICT